MFDNLPAGAYRVLFDNLPYTWPSFTWQAMGADAAKDSNPTWTGLTPAFEVGGGHQNSRAVFETDGPLAREVDGV